MSTTTPPLAEAQHQEHESAGNRQITQPCEAVQRKEIREKMESKLLVATFLGVFTFTALLELVKEPDKVKETDTALYAAIICLTAALSLFVVAVYIYDFLGTPWYWWRQPGKEKLSGKLLNLRVGVQKLLKYDHPIIETMIRPPDSEGSKNNPDWSGSEIFASKIEKLMKRTWKRVFTPAVFMATVGFVLLVARSSTSLALVVFGIFVVAFLYWFIERPPYGFD